MPHSSSSTTPTRAQGTVLAAQLRLTAQTDQAASEALWALRQYIETTIAAHSGQLQVWDNLNFVAVWEQSQLPAGSETAEPALRAGLAIQQAVKNWSSAEIASTPVGAQVQMGAHTDAWEAPLLATTPVRQQALSLCAAATLGQLLVSHACYRGVRGVFDVQLHPVADPALGYTYTVLQAKQRAFRLAAHTLHGLETATVGREAEMLRLQDHLRVMLDQKRLQVVTLVGEAGSGKSRLLYEFDNWLDLIPENVLIFRGRAGEETRHAPYALLRDIFSFRFEILENDPPLTARTKFQRGCLGFLGNTTEAVIKAHFLGHLLGLEFGDSPHIRGLRDEQRQIHDLAFHYFIQIVQAATRQHPVVLALDDVQWADDSSLDGLSQLVQACQNYPLFVLILSRPSVFERFPTWGESWEPHTRLDLPPLSELECQDLADDLLQKAPEPLPEFTAHLARQAQGNPFFVEETFRWLIDRRLVQPGDPYWQVDEAQLAQLTLPASLAELLQARFAEFTPAEQLVLQKAASLGRLFWDQPLLTLPLPAETIAATLRQLRQRELIIQRSVAAFPDTQAFVFRSTLLRDTAYASLPPAQQVRYHQHNAQWFTSRYDHHHSEYATFVAEQHERAHMLVEASTWYQRAADLLRQANAPLAAWGLYHRALGLADQAQVPEKDRVALYEGLAETAYMEVRSAEAIQAFTQMRAAAEHLGDLRAQARACTGLATANSNYRVALDFAQQAERLARQAQATTELIDALYEQGWSLYGLGEGDAARQLAEKLLAQLNQPSATQQHKRARCFNLLGVIHQMHGFFEMSDYYREQALAIYQDLGDRHKVALMLNNLAETARLRGNYAAAITRYQEPLHLARELGKETLTALILSNLGGARAVAGNAQAAEADLQQALALAVPLQASFLPETYCFLALTRLRQQRLPEAAAAAQQGLALALQNEDHSSMGLAWRVLGQVRAQWPASLPSDLPAARDCFEKSAEIFTAISKPHERARTLGLWAQYEMKHNTDYQRGKLLWAEARALFAQLDMQHEIDRVEE